MEVERIGLIVLVSLTIIVVILFKLVEVIKHMKKVVIEWRNFRDQCFRREARDTNRDRRESGKSQKKPKPSSRNKKSKRMRKCRAIKLAKDHADLHVGIVDGHLEQTSGARVRCLSDRLVFVFIFGQMTHLNLSHNHLSACCSGEKVCLTFVDQGEETTIECWLKVSLPRDGTVRE